jgi:hypothetical protein
MIPLKILNQNPKIKIKTKTKKTMKTLPKGFPTHTKDITGRTICLGDRVGFDFADNTSNGFEVVFEFNAFRKKYKGHTVGSVLGDQHEADKLRYIVLSELVENAPVRFCHHCDEGVLKRRKATENEGSQFGVFFVYECSNCPEIYKDAAE